MKTILSLVLALACASAAPLHVQFALTFISNPQNGVNHATTMSQTLKTALSEGGVVFSDAVATQGASLVWTSSLVGQTDSQWSEIGNVTMVDASGNEQGAIVFQSFGYSGNVGPSIPGLPDVSYGGISYREQGCVRTRLAFCN
jgi:hypothetical protein